MNDFNVSKNTVVFSVLIALALYAFANQRTVSIPSGSDGISLVNGSPVQVDYSVTCYNGSGGSTNMGSTSLAARGTAKLEISAATTCANGTNVQYADDFINGMFSCGYTDWTSYQTVCPAGYHRCTSAEVLANVSGYTGFNPLLFDSSDFSDVWYYRYNNTSAWNTATQSMGGHPVWSNGSSSECNKSDTNNSSLTVSSCTTSLHGDTACCPDFIATACDVTIQNTTPTGGYLQSPQFKSNAPF